MGEPVDCAVVGAGAAGCGAALALARARRTVLLVGNDSTRNSVAKTSHLFPSREGLGPAALQSALLHDVTAYSEVQHRDMLVDSIQHKDSVFQIRLSDGSLCAARKVVLAMGVKDLLPPVPGLAGRWGIDVNSCLFCHGYEFSGPASKLAVLGASESDFLTAASLSLKHSTDVVVLTNTDEPPALSPLVEAAILGTGIKIMVGRLLEVAPLSAGKGLSIKTTNSKVEITALFLHPETEQKSSLVSLLGCKIDSDGLVELDSTRESPAAFSGTGLTSVPGVYAAGDMTSHSKSKQLVVASAHGTTVGIQVSEALWEEDIKAGVMTTMKAIMTDPSQAKSMPQERLVAIQQLAAQMGLTG